MDYIIQPLHGKARSIALNAPGVEGYVLGRADDATTFTPDIDLNSFDARDMGVSRRHAALIVFQGELHLIDLGSVNGTYVNSNRLASHQPFAVHLGDELRLGKLELILLRQQADR